MNEIIKSITEKVKKSNQYKWFLTNEEIKYLDDNYGFAKNLKTKIKCLINGVTGIPLCSFCGQPVKNIFKVTGKVNGYCSHSCSINNPDVRGKIIKSFKSKKHSSSERNTLIYKKKLSHNVPVSVYEETETSIKNKISTTSQWHHMLSEDELNYLNFHFSFVKTLSEMGYCLKNNIREFPKCVICNNPTSSIKSKYCSKKCLSGDEEINTKISNSVSIGRELESKLKRLYSGRRWKLYSKNNVEFLYQGYEDKGFDFLIELGYNIDDIFPHPHIQFKYEYEGKIRNYRPDFYIPQDNLYIDVKSPFTFNIELEKNDAKRKAVEKLGHKFKFLIIGDKILYE